MHLAPCQLPPNFVNPIPRRGPWIDPAEHSDQWECVSALLEDGTTEPVVWTGKLWWRDRELKPVGWRRVEPMHQGPVRIGSDKEFA